MWEVLHILVPAYCALFITWVMLEDNSIADIFWWVWFVIVSWILFINWVQEIAQVFVLILITFWWVRLFSFFIGRKKRLKAEDPRYAQWRKEWEYFYLRSFFQVYILQMLLMLLVAIPLFYIFSSNNFHPLFTTIWIIIAIFGLGYEIIADAQIVKFLKNKKEGENTVYTGWLWKYSRNPNYFWESTFWLWISIISFPISPFGIIWYLVITSLLLFVSWVPIKEKRQTHKDNWKEYSQKTNCFIPWFPKK